MAKPSGKTAKARGERESGTLRDGGVKRALAMPPAGNAVKKPGTKKPPVQKPR